MTYKSTQLRTTLTVRSIISIHYFDYISDFSFPGESHEGEKMSKTRGRVTLPSEGNFLEETKEMMERWGADALRDSDGTKLPEEIKELDATIYTTYFVARELVGAHQTEFHEVFLPNHL